VQSAEDRRRLVIAQLDTESSVPGDDDSPPANLMNSLAIRQEVQAAQAVDGGGQRPPATMTPPLLQASPEMYRRSMHSYGSPPDGTYPPYMVPGTSPPFPMGHPAHPSTQPQYMSAQHHDMYNPNILGLSPPNQVGYSYMPMQHYPSPPMYPHQPGPYPAPGTSYPSHMYGYPGYPPAGPPPGMHSAHSIHSNPTASVMECPSCRQRVMPSRFCSNCGQSLTASMSDSSPSRSFDAPSAPVTASVTAVAAQPSGAMPSGARTPKGLATDEDVTPQGSPERKNPL
jgi:ribosomal protein L32